MTDYDALILVHDTEEFKEMISTQEIEPIFIRLDEHESLVIEYIFPSDDVETYHSLVFVLNTKDKLIENTYKAFTKYGATVYESLHTNQIETLSLACDYWACTKTKINYSYDPIPGCSYVLGQNCSAFTWIPKYGAIVKYACKGSLWAYCNISRNTICIEGKWYYNVCIS